MNALTGGQGQRAVRLASRHLAPLRSVLWEMHFKRNFVKQPTRGYGEFCLCPLTLAGPSR